MQLYDEESIKGRLDLLPRAGKTAFAALCAEWLQPAYDRFHERTGQGAPPQLGAALTDVWDALGSVNRDVSAARGVAEDLVPRENEDWLFEMGFAQHAASAVAYAARTWAADDSQEAAWAARQVYEAADYVTFVRCLIST